MFYEMLYKIPGRYEVVIRVNMRMRLAKHVRGNTDMETDVRDVKDLLTDDCLETNPFPQYRPRVIYIIDLPCKGCTSK